MIASTVRSVRNRAAVYTQAPDLPVWDRLHEAVRVRRDLAGGERIVLARRGG